jgi:hypothetical protein
VFAERWHLLDSSSSDARMAVLYSSGQSMLCHALSSILGCSTCSICGVRQSHEAVRPPARITRLPFFDVNLLTPPLVGIRQTQTVESTPRTPQYVFT